MMFISKFSKQSRRLIGLFHSMICGHICWLIKLFSVFFYEESWVNHFIASYLNSPLHCWTASASTFYCCQELADFAPVG